MHSWLMFRLIILDWPIMEGCIRRWIAQGFAGFRNAFWKEYYGHVKTNKLQLQTSSWPIEQFFLHFQTWSWPRLKISCSRAILRLNREQHFVMGFFNWRYHFKIVIFGLIDAVFWCGRVLQRQPISKIHGSWFSHNSILKSVSFSFKSSVRFL